MRSTRIQRFKDAKANLDEQITRWLEHNDPDAFFGDVSHRRRMERILEFTRDVQGKIVDIGPFAGVLSERILAQGGKEIYGLDSHETALRLAARRGVLPVFADVEEEGIASEDNSFDAAIMGDVLSYIIDPDFVLSEVQRVLKPGSKFILSLPNLASLSNRLLTLLGHGPYELDIRPYGGGYQRYYTFGSLRTLLEQHGFEVVRMETNHIHLPLYRMPITWRFFKSGGGVHSKWLYCHWLARVFPKLGEHIIVLARKHTGSAVHAATGNQVAKPAQAEAREESPV